MTPPIILNAGTSSPLTGTDLSFQQAAKSLAGKTIPELLDYAEQSDVGERVEKVMAANAPWWALLLVMAAVNGADKDEHLTNKAQALETMTLVLSQAIDYLMHKSKQDVVEYLGKHENFLPHTTYTYATALQGALNEINTMEDVPDIQDYQRIFNRRGIYTKGPNAVF